MKFRQFVFGMAVFAATFCNLTMAEASTVLVPTTAKFTSLAQIIAHVKVEKTEARWVDGHIITTVTARVVEPLKGSKATEVVTFNIPGGRVGNLEAIASGTPTISTNEELVLYLEEGRYGQRQLLGQALGMYRVRYDDKKGQFMATRDISKLGLIAASPEVKVEQIPRIRELKLQDLKNEIRQQIEESKGVTK